MVFPYNFTKSVYRDLHQNARIVDLRIILNNISHKLISGWCQQSEKIKGLSRVIEPESMIK